MKKITCLFFISVFILAASSYAQVKPKTYSFIEGHTDNVGAKDYNQQLSAKRAESVKNYLIKTFGIEESRLTSKGYGISKPIADNKTKQGRQQNRRVEAVVDSSVQP